MSYVSGTVLNQISLNGYVFTHQPTDHHWMPKEPTGIDGNGIAVYPAYREYELKFDFLDTDEWTNTYQAFQAQGVTGSLVAVLPKWNATPYQWYSYSGVQIREMEYDGWFQNYYQNVRLLIVKVLTT